MLHKHSELLKKQIFSRPTMSDYNVDSWDLYVDFSVIHVGLSDYFVDFSEKY